MRAGDRTLKACRSLPLPCLRFRAALRLRIRPGCASAYEALSVRAEKLRKCSS